MWLKTMVNNKQWGFFTFTYISHHFYCFSYSSKFPGTHSQSPFHIHQHIGVPSWLQRQKKYCSISFSPHLSNESFSFTFLLTQTQEFMWFKVLTQLCFVLGALGMAVLRFSVNHFSCFQSLLEIFLSIHNGCCFFLSQEDICSSTAEIWQKPTSYFEQGSLIFLVSVRSIRNEQDSLMFKM